jgi:hypothetical protein
MFTSRTSHSADRLPQLSGIAESELKYLEPNSLEPNRLEFSHQEEPSTPFRERDEQVLTELFHQEDIEAIEQDIACNLLWRCPEPCWEDDPFEFLQEFLY